MSSLLCTNSCDTSEGGAPLHADGLAHFVFQILVGVVPQHTAVDECVLLPRIPELVRCEGQLPSRCACAVYSWFDEWLEPVVHRMCHGMPHCLLAAVAGRGDWLLVSALRACMTGAAV